MSSTSEQHNVSLLLEEQRQREKEARRAIGEGIAVLMEFGHEVGVYVEETRMASMPTTSYEKARCAVVLHVTPDGLALLAAAARTRALAAKEVA